MNTTRRLSIQKTYPIHRIWVWWVNVQCWWNLCSLELLVWWFDQIIWFFVYIYRERDRDRERENEYFQDSLSVCCKFPFIGSLAYIAKHTFLDKDLHHILHLIKNITYGQRKVKIREHANNLILPKIKSNVMLWKINIIHYGNKG